jgi:predicted pyridoxine 5'-phosphate oxidase superfamily flavin-nucleotide-binding protein
MTWRELEVAAPVIAQLGRERLDEARVALLGTVRKDGSPRISPVEPYLVEGHLIFGAMSWSLKARDLLLDPRCVLHSAVTGPDSGEGELKLYGRAVAAREEIRDRCGEAWWLEQPAQAASVFSLEIKEATFIEWELERGEMTIRRWSLPRGYRETRRRYP